MHIPSAHLDALNKMSAENYSEWLLVGIRGWLQQEQQYKLFAPIGLLLKPNEDLGVQLASVYETLNAPAQSNFKQGLSLSVANCRDADEWQPTLRLLVWLAKHLKASAALKPILAVLNGFLKTANSPEVLRSRAFIINILAGWIENPAVVNALVQLLKQPNYLFNTYVPVVFLNLLKAHPEKLAKYAKYVRPHFIALQNEGKIMPKLFTLGLIDKMGIANLAKYLPDLSIDCTNNINNDNWLLEIIFDSTSPLKLTRNEKGDYLKIGAFSQKLSESALKKNFSLGYWVGENCTLSEGYKGDEHKLSKTLLDDFKDWIGGKNNTGNVICPNL